MLFCKVRTEHEQDSKAFLQTAETPGDFQHILGKKE